MHSQILCFNRQYFIFFLGRCYRILMGSGIQFGKVCKVWTVCIRALLLVTNAYIMKHSSIVFVLLWSVKKIQDRMNFVSWRKCFIFISLKEKKISSGLNWKIAWKSFEICWTCWQQDDNDNFRPGHGYWINLKIVRNLGEQLSMSGKILLTQSEYSIDCVIFDFQHNTKHKRSNITIEMLNPCS